MSTVVDRCTRSTLYIDDVGMLRRQYADTDAHSDPFPCQVDERGNRRCSGNRRIDSLVREASTYRGARRREPPPHLRTTLSLVCRLPRCIDSVATSMAVSRNTAWSYVCRVVEQWPEAAECATRLVDGDLFQGLEECDDLTGSLTDLMKRLPGSATHGVREFDDRYAQLRLGRLCVESLRKKHGA